MFQVIRKQQRVIREQGKVIQTLGREYEDFNGIEEKHEESDEGRTTSSLHDSVLEESGEETSQRPEVTEMQSDNQDVSDVSIDEENSDSYVTMSDASFTDSDEEEDDQIEKEEET